MIEFLRGPVGRGVAIGALGALTPAVHVIGQVAADALLGRAFEVLARVAGRARHVAMLVGEREFRLVVIEARLAPCGGHVARGTVDAEGAAVRVVVLVTTDTSCRRFAIRSIGAVATGARERRVRSLQRKVGEIVGKTGLAELVDVRVPALVFRVAAAALAGGGRGHAPVIAGLGADVGGDLLVAVEAQRGLPVAVRAVVAAAAITLQLRMRFAHRPGHDQLLDTGRACGRSDAQGK